MVWQFLLIYLAPFFCVLIYKITSSIGFFRTLFMFAGALFYCIFGFINAKADYSIVTSDWWKAAGMIWGGASIFYMYLFADFSWEPHYYDEYTFVERLFGAPSIEVREGVEFHWFRWVLISMFLGAGTFGIGVVLQDIIIKYKGFLMCGIIGVLFLIVFIGRIITKIVHSRI